MKTLSKVFLTRKLKLYFPESESENSDNLKYALSISANLTSLGFILDEEVISFLSERSVQYLEGFYKWIVPILEEMTGANRIHKPFYPNFPKEVMDADWVDLYFNAIIHYLTNGCWKPNDDADVRLPITPEKDKLKVIKIGTLAEFEDMIISIITSKTSISENDKCDLKLISQMPEYSSLLIERIEEIPHKEILAYVTGLVMAGDTDLDMARYYKTPTDVLRLAVSLSNGDISLATNTKFISFSRKTRRYLLSLLNRIADSYSFNSALEDMASRKNVWKRLGERLHPGEYYEVIPGKGVQSLFHEIRNNPNLLTFNSKLEDAIKTSVEDAIEILKKRPGMFARKLDELLRKNSEDDGFLILSAFNKVIEKVSTPVLLSVRGHFDGRRRRGVDFRTFIPKGRGGKVTVVPDTLPDISECVILELFQILENEFISRFSKLERLGKVRIHPDLYRILVPFSQRDSSSGFRTLTRGSRLALDYSSNIVRGSIHWHDQKLPGGGTDITDIDLSVNLFSSEWENLGNVWYGNLRDEFLNGYSSALHSGDIVKAPYPNGAHESIDLNIAALRRNGVRFVSFSANSFTGQVFSDLDVSFFIQTLEHGQVGEVFEPSRVEVKLNLTSNSKANIPAILDLENMELIWADINATTFHTLPNNVIYNYKKGKSIAQGLESLHMTRASLGFLFEMHSVARASYCDIYEGDENDDDDTLVFGVFDGDITALDLDIIASKFM